MPRQHHHLKTESRYYQEVERGRKKFEFRLDDRNFQVGDMVYLDEVLNGEKTSRSMAPVEIQYILRGPAFGLPNGTCIFNW